MEWNVSPEIMQSLKGAIRPVRAELPLRQILADHFPRDCANLPISGGWGYSRDDAIVFVRDLFPGGRAINFQSLEHHIAQKLIYEELIIVQDENCRFSGIELLPRSQRLISNDSRHYDCCDFEVCCWSDLHWEQLKEEFETECIPKQSRERQLAHFAKRNESKITYERQFWFDITDVFGRA